MGRIITSPAALGELGEKSIFLAGGISDCADWQKDVAERIAAETNATVYNPRRIDFNMDAYEETSKLQIVWEYHALRFSTVNLFWFPAETICPISLFEYGSALERMRRGSVMCGTHPDYVRRFDVVFQTELMQHCHVYDDLTALVDETIILLNSF